MQSTDRERCLEALQGLAREISPEREPSLELPTHLEWDLGIGSLERVELARRLEAALQRRLPDQELFLARSVSDLLELVERDPAELASGRPARLRPGVVPPPPALALTLLEALEYQAQHQSEATRLVVLREDQVDRSLSYPELLREVRILAAALLPLGVGPGDRVGLMLPTGVPFVAAFHAVLWLGAIPVPLYPPFRLDQAEDYLRRQAAILDNAGVQVLVTFSRAYSLTGLLRMRVPALRHVVSVESLVAPPIDRPHAAQADQVALIQYTSGSTGIPKGVVLTHANLLHNVRAYGMGLHVTADDVVVSWLPLYHDMGLIGSLLGSIYHGLPLILMGPQDFLARPVRWLRALSDYAGTISPAPNFAFEICARKLPDEELQGLDLNAWRVALNGAETVRPETLERFSQRFAAHGFRPEAHFPAYGLAEAALAVTFSPPGRGARTDRLAQAALEQNQARPAQDQEPSLTLISCGLPLQDNELEIRDERGQPLGPRQVGRLYFRSPSSLREYFRNPEATRQVKDERGWVDTGDLAYLAEGELYLTGRRKDLILKAGRNLYPQDIEALASEVKGVRRGCVAAFGVADPDSGTELVVVVCEALRPPAGLAEAVKARVTQGMGVPPDRVVLVPPHSVPKTPSGKIRRGECKRLYQTGRLGRRQALAAQLGRAFLASARGLRPRHLYGAWTTGWLFGLALLVGLAASLRPAWGRSFSRRASRMVLWVSGIPLKIEDPGPWPARCLVVSNHASILDPLVVLAACPRSARFLVAPWVSDTPFLKWVLQRLGQLRSSRGQGQQVGALVESIRAVLDQGDTVVSFPEGGLEPSPGLRVFALGAFQVAAQEGVAIIPVALQGTRQVLPWPSWIPRMGSEVRVSFGPPMSAGGSSFEEASQLARRCRSWIAEHCGESVKEERLRRED